MPFPFGPAQGDEIGNATPSQVLAGYTFSSAKAGIGVSGTMPNYGSPTLMPGAAILPGYYAGGQVAPAGLFDVAARVTALGGTEAPVFTDLANYAGSVESLVIADMAKIPGSIESLVVSDMASYVQNGEVEPFPITDSAAQT